jgi:YYY domain-containing protein
MTSLAIGALAMPLSFRLFRRFPDGGAGLSFALGLTLVGWTYFTLRTLDILPAGRGGAVLAVAVLALVAAGAAGQDRRFRSTLQIAWPGMMAVAGLFTLCLFGYVAFRSYSPEISGTEQPMDLMYLNASINSPEYPPQDPWLAGERASYYYFGYVQVGILTQVSGASASEGYNLGLAYTFAAAATAIASLAFALARWVLGPRARQWALAAAGTGVVLLLLLGSLAGVLELAAAHGWGGAGLYESFGVEWMQPCEPGQTADCRPESEKWYPTRFFFWFDDTRVIRSTPENTDTITEFPVFSFILGDLHPHVMSLPLVLLVMGVAATAWRGRSRLDFAALRRDPLMAVIVGLLVGALAFQNAWDLLTFSALLVVAVFARNLRRVALWPAVRDSAGWLGPVFGLAVVAYLPWYLDFSSQAEGLYPYVGVGSRPNQAFLQFGALFSTAALAVVWAVRREDRQALADAALYTAWVPLVPALLWIGLASFHGQLGDAVDARGSGGWVTLTVYALAVWLLATLFAVAARRGRPAAFALGLAATGVLLLYGAELLVIKDVFYGGAPRLNTIFKLSYQAWALLSVAGAVTLVAAAERAVGGRQAVAWLFAPVAAVVALGLVFVVIATANRTEGFSGDTTIDGLAFLARSDPAEYDLTRWLEDNVPAGDVILEATGRQYGRDTDGAPRSPMAVSTMGTAAASAPAQAGRRQSAGISTRSSGEATRQRTSRPFAPARTSWIASIRPTTLPPCWTCSGDGRDHLVVGAVERRKYGDLMPDFAAFLDVAFAAGDYRVYRVPELRWSPHREYRGPEQSPTTAIEAEERTVTVPIEAVAWSAVGLVFALIRLWPVWQMPVGGAELEHLSGAWNASIGLEDERYVPTLFQALTALLFSFTTSEIPARLVAFLATATVPSRSTCCALCSGRPGRCLRCSCSRLTR